MYSESDLEAAVSAGALTPDQAAAFRTYVASTRHTPVVDEESFRLLTGFNDIFVSIAAVILLVALAWIGHAIPPNIEGDGPTPWMGLFVAGAAWGLAEYFTLRRRMALPSILLLLAFVGGTIATVGFALVNGIGEEVLDDNATMAAWVLALSAGAGVAAAFAHWRRFRVPITVAAGAAALVGLVLGLIASGFAADRMSDEQKLRMFNSQEEVNAILAKRDNERLVCKNVKPIGSHIPVRQCMTAGELEARRRADDQYLRRTQKTPQHKSDRT